MTARQKSSKIFQYVSGIFLMLTLASLTISLPFVNAARQKIQLEKNVTVNVPGDDCEEDSDNPFASSTEHKAPGSVNTVNEEYIHDMLSYEQYLAALAREYRVEHVSIYKAFYGELVSPPPDIS